MQFDYREKKIMKTEATNFCVKFFNAFFYRQKKFMLIFEFFLVWKNTFWRIFITFEIITNCFFQTWKKIGIAPIMPNVWNFIWDKISLVRKSDVIFFSLLSAKFLFQFSIRKKCADKIVVKFVDENCEIQKKKWLILNQFFCY